MATVRLPPRLVKKEDSIKRPNGKSAFEVLEQMGFPRHRAEKALAATGYRGVSLASDWLLSHVHDPKLDEDAPREFVLYLCPVGQLQTELTQFWEKSLETSGWNGAHASFPHITLCPFFKVPDSKVPIVTKALLSLQDKLNNAPGKVNLDFFSQKSFIGLFVSGLHFKFLEELVAAFAEDMKKAGILVEPHKKQMHLTLAYQYKLEHHDTLVRLAQQINTQASVRWDFRLYSRDPAFSQYQVMRVIHQYPPSLHDELELIDGDFIFVTPKEMEQSKDGWYHGTSWLTGSSGMFPSTLTEQAAETWTWTLHKSLPLQEASPVANGKGWGDGDYDNLWSDAGQDLYAKVDKTKKETQMHAEPQRLYVMRHGERCDFVFGRDWLEKVYDESGTYRRINLNLPRKMIKRKSHLEFFRDCPLTEMGMHQARLTGEGFKEAGVVISHIYSSPSLRCVQTAQGMLQGMGSQVKICIEPALFEWMGWYQPLVPSWLKPETLVQNGYAVDSAYKPISSFEVLTLDETVEDYYNRCACVSKQITQQHEKDRGNILIVAHAASLDVCTRHLRGRSIPSKAEFQEMLPAVSFCAVSMCERDPTSKKWVFREPHVGPLTHFNNKPWNWKMLA